MAKSKSDPAGTEAPRVDIERECEAWDWVRPAGVSVQELRKALRESLPQDPE